ncbi:MAG: metallophosphoesterase [Victivallales bacterium]|nr:metallophosphoesterase [Victivallales bacterium]
MNRVLFISDLHLADIRNGPGRDARLLAALSTLIRNRHYRAVINLGDTVSRAGYLLRGTTTREAFNEYLQWRNDQGVPFRECAIFRERPFFRDIFGQEEDSVWKGIQGVVILTFSPCHEDDHTATDAQWQWLSAQVKSAVGQTLVLASHVPYPGCCSRADTPGVYLPVPQPIRHQLETRGEATFWGGGHFHWNEEPPVTRGSLTAFMGGRFLIDAEPTKTTYLRELDLDTLELRTIFPD